LSTEIVAITTPEIVVAHARGKAKIPDPVHLTRELSKIDGTIVDVEKMRAILDAEKVEPGCAVGENKFSDTELFQIVLRIIEWVETLGKSAAPTRN